MKTIFQITENESKSMIFFVRIHYDRWTVNNFYSRTLCSSLFLRISSFFLFLFGGIQLTTISGLLVVTMMRESNFAICVIGYCNVINEALKIEATDQTDWVFSFHIQCAMTSSQFFCDAYTHNFCVRRIFKCLN